MADFYSTPAQDNQRNMEEMERLQQSMRVWGSIFNLGKRMFGDSPQGRALEQSRAGQQLPPLPPPPHEATVNLPPALQRVVAEIKRRGVSPMSNPRFTIPELGSAEHLAMTQEGKGGGLQGGTIRLNPALAHGLKTTDEQMGRTVLHEMSHEGQRANSNPLYNLRVGLEGRFLPHDQRYEEQRAGLEAESLLARMRAINMAQQLARLEQ